MSVFIGRLWIYYFKGKPKRDWDIRWFPRGTGYRHLESSKQEPNIRIPTLRWILIWRFQFTWFSQYHPTIQRRNVYSNRF